MNHTDRTGLWLLIAAIPFMVLLVLFATRQKTTMDEPVEKTISMIEVNYELLRNSLTDSCNLKDMNLKVSESLINDVLRNVDSTTYEKKGNTIKIKGNIIKTKGEKKGKYISLPATLLANMIDMELIVAPQKENEE